MGIKLNIKDINPEELDLQEKIEMQEAADYFKASAERHRQNEKEMRKVFLTVGIIVLALAVIFFAIMAWFANNKKVTGEGMNVNAEALHYYISSYYTYYVDKSSGTPVYKRKAYSASTTFRMSDYDAQFGDNDTTAIYLKIPIISYEKFDSTTHKLTITIGRDASAKWRTATSTGSVYTSSLVALKCGAVSALWDLSDGAKKDLYDGADEEKCRSVYNASKDNFKSVTGTTYFIDETKPSTATYKTSISFDVNDYKVYTYKSSGVRRYVTYIYIEMDYCDALIKKYYKIDENGYGDVGTTTYKHANTKRDSTKIKVLIDPK